MRRIKQRTLNSFLACSERLWRDEIDSGLTGLSSATSATDGPRRFTAPSAVYRTRGLRRRPHGARVLAFTSEVNQFGLPRDNARTSKRVGTTSSTIVVVAMTNARQVTQNTQRRPGARSPTFGSSVETSIIVHERRRTRPIPAGRDYHDAAVQLPRTGHSGLPQRFLQANVADADHSDVRCGCAILVLGSGTADVQGTR